MPHRKKVKDVNKPFCWYCGRIFDDNRVLVDHQKAKHFKCTKCRRRFKSAEAVATHFSKVHGETLKKFFRHYIIICLLLRFV